MSPCVKCNGPIDAVAIANKAKIAARLFPGRAVPPPKVCTTCLWDSLMQLVSDHEIKDDQELALMDDALLPGEDKP